jgi:hypothetical protein
MYIFTLIHVYTFQKDHPAMFVRFSLLRPGQWQGLQRVTTNAYSEEKIKRQCCYNFCLLKKINYSKAIDNSLVWHSVGKKQYDIDQSNELHDYSLM